MRRFLVAAMAAACAACVAKGDFGRPAPGLAEFELSFYAGSPDSESHLPYTDDERELRERAWAFLSPSGDGAALGPDRYAADLLAADYASSEARYARIEADIAADRTRIGPVLKLAAQVEKLDRARVGALSYVPEVAPREVGAAAARIDENRALIDRLHDAFGWRAAAYRMALERLAIATPSYAAARVEHRLIAFETYIHRS
jgi:hypothetical protein